MYSAMPVACSQSIREVGGNGKGGFYVGVYGLLGIERKHRQIFTAEDAGGGRREVMGK